MSDLVEELEKQQSIISNFHHLKGKYEHIKEEGQKVTAEEVAEDIKNALNNELINN